jgi:hypothetical protein
VKAKGSHLQSGAAVPGLRVLGVRFEKVYETTRKLTLAKRTGAKVLVLDPPSPDLPTPTQDFP